MDLPMLVVFLVTVVMATISALLLISYFLIKHVNVLITTGPLYAIRRDNGTPKEPHLCTGFMHEISHPWRRGKGIQIRVRNQIVQVGLCRKHPHQKEDEGALSAIGGRYMDTDVKDIRGW